MMQEANQRVRTPRRAPRQLVVAGAGFAAVLAVAIVALVVLAGGGGTTGAGGVVIESKATPTATPERSLRVASVKTTPAPTAATAPSPTTAPEEETEPDQAPTAFVEDDPTIAPTPTATAAPPPPIAPPPANPPPTGAVAGQRIYSNGDSTSYFMSVGVLQIAAEQGAIQAQPAPEYQISSGLSNSSFFDWYGYFASEMAAYNPDVVVFMIGANDAYVGMDLAAYRQRVAQMMDQLQGHRLIWVGEPNMGRADLAEALPAMNAIFADEASKRAWVRFVDTWSLTSDANGYFTPYLPDGTLARADDGVHFTSSGGYYLAQAVVAVIAGG